MRSLVVIIVFTAILAGCKRKDSNTASVTSELTGLTENVSTDSSQFTSIEWKETNIDFGRIREGQKLEVVFRFKNTGNKPLVITRVVPSCGCTVAEKPSEPIAPGKEGVIKGAFDSNGRIGMQHKTIEVGANTKGIQNHQLVFEVDVEKKS